MSVVAEFAAQLHKKHPIDTNRAVSPLVGMRGKSERLLDVQAVIFDVYGTLIDYWENTFKSTEEKQAHLLATFRRTADYFGFTETLKSIDGAKAPEKTLSDFYHGLITLKHEESRKSGKQFPEIRIEEIWEVILSILINNGYNIDEHSRGDRRDTTLCICYYYNFFALNRGFFAEVVPALQALKEQNIKLGIISNAQFYTPIDLTLFLRDQQDQMVDYLELFDQELLYFSYDYGVAKPSRFFFERLMDSLNAMDILPEQTVFVGNDLALDVQAAAEVGLRTALFAGNRYSTFMHELKGEVMPDIVFTSYENLPKKISFYSDEQR